MGLWKKLRRYKRKETQRSAQERLEEERRKAFKKYELYRQLLFHPWIFIAIL